MLTHFGHSAARRLLVACLLLLVVLMPAASVFANQKAENGKRNFSLFLPGVFDLAPAEPPAVVSLINQFRRDAGVPIVVEDPTLDNNCAQHARYMAENNQLTHEQDPNLPFATNAGQYCAEHSNTWIGSDFPQPIWSPDDSIQGWMGSVGHRLWLLYPTTKAVGFGFHMANSNRAAAAIDVLSAADFAADDAYNDWPVRSPGNEEIDVPAERYPITVNWSYFGSSPRIHSTKLKTRSGISIAHDASTYLPAGHKGIQIVPKQPFPAGSQIVVEISGRYDGQPFNYTWQFSTSNQSANALSLSSYSLGSAGLVPISDP